MKASIELDIAYEDSLEDAVRRLLGGSDDPFLSLSAEVVDTYGPGGGWPLVKFSGDLTDVVQLIRRYAGDDLETALDMCESIEQQDES